MNYLAGYFVVFGLFLLCLRYVVKIERLNATRNAEDRIRRAYKNCPLETHKWLCGKRERLPLIPDDDEEI